MLAIKADLLGEVSLVWLHGASCGWSERAGSSCASWRSVGCDRAEVVILFQVYPGTPPGVSLPFLSRITKCICANSKQAPIFATYIHLLLIPASRVLLICHAHLLQPPHHDPLLYSLATHSVCLPAYLSCEQFTKPSELEVIQCDTVGSNLLSLLDTGQR